MLRTARRPTEQFSGLADAYARSRPKYPTESIDFILSHCSLGAGSVIADLGCGTGISSRQFAARGIHVIGIEPNAEMRAQAESAGSAETSAPIEYRAGTGEQTGLGDASVDAIVAAQSFHWFKPHKALSEFHRIIKPGGWVIIMYNNRDESDPFTAEYGGATRKWPETGAAEILPATSMGRLLKRRHFSHTAQRVFANELILDEEAMLLLTKSTSYAPRDKEGIEAFTEEVRAIFRKYATNSHARLVYETSVFVGQRAPSFLEALRTRLGF